MLLHFRDNVWWLPRNNTRRYSGVVVNERHTLANYLIYRSWRWLWFKSIWYNSLLNCFICKGRIVKLPTTCVLLYLRHVTLDGLSEDNKYQYGINMSSSVEQIISIIIIFTRNNSNKEKMIPFLPTGWTKRQRPLFHNNNIITNTKTTKLLQYINWCPLEGSYLYVVPTTLYSCPCSEYQDYIVVQGSHIFFRLLYNIIYLMYFNRNATELQWLRMSKRFVSLSSYIHWIKRPKSSHGHLYDKAVLRAVQYWLMKNSQKNLRGNKM